MAADKKTEQVAPRVTPEDMERLKSEYKSANRGAQESCHYWPLVRQAMAPAIRKKFTEKETDALQALEIPRECDRKLLEAILTSQKLKCVGRVRQMSDVEAIVLTDLIANAGLKKPITAEKVDETSEKDA